MVLGQHAYEGGLKTLVTPLRMVLLSIQNLYYKMRGRKTGDFSILLEYFWNVDLYLGKMFATKQNKNARSAIFTWLYVVSREIRTGNIFKELINDMKNTLETNLATKIDNINTCLNEQD